ncbi:MAG: cell division protein SepF [Bacillota bacterium]|jgi:cell division inhibitor SepF|nr:cell division protein SepF [Eubacteriales bacterium]MDD3537236.1 cell division protein SepF [Eubacteriales bacterium]MDD4285922.1 cell division protein SepF [Eubacteriales bacterium]MDI9491706.1 cell division protein SepF [Bacillota bacterium]HPF18456.1 cell division protein SepF [Bacillota bacterium]
MGLFNKMKEMVGIEEIDDDELETAKKPAVPERKPIESRPSAKSSYSEPSKPVEMRSPTLPGGRRTDQFKMVVVEPSGFEDSPRLVDNLKAKKPVIINLENLETDTARKIFDFLSGATYALNGNVQKVANNIFVFVPENVDVAYNTDSKVNLAEGGIKSPWK